MQTLAERHEATRARHEAEGDPLDAPPNRAARRRRPPKHTRTAVFPEGRHVLVHLTHTPPWLAKARRRAENAVARQSRKANRP